MSLSSLFERRETAPRGRERKSDDRRASTSLNRNGLVRGVVALLHVHSLRVLFDRRVRRYFA